jgi:hypothetical protein
MTGIRAGRDAPQLHLAVDTAALDRLAERIRRAAAEAHAAATDPAPLYAAIEALAAPSLVQAARVFMHGWGATLAGIVDDAHRLADAVELVGRSYRDAESVLSRGMSR